MKKRIKSLDVLNSDAGRIQNIATKVFLIRYRVDGSPCFEVFLTNSEAEEKIKHLLNWRSEIEKQRAKNGLWLEEDQIIIYTAIETTEIHTTQDWIDFINHDLNPLWHGENDNDDEDEEDGET